MKDKVIWVVDDEPAICWSLKRALERENALVRTFSNAEDAIEAIKQPNLKCDLIITDLRLPRGDGFSVVDAVTEANLKTPVIMITAFGDLSTAIEAMRTSVAEYLPKPFDLNDIKRAIKKAFARNSVPIQPATNFRISIGEALLLGQSKAIQEVYKWIALAARSNVPVLLIGPDGSPLESVAAAIHKNSEQNDAPFLPLTPASIPLHSLERELVGAMYDENGSDDLRTGLLGLVGSGSLYVSEVADLPKNAQHQLQRVLDEGAYTPFGSTLCMKCKARIITATTRELHELVKTDEFLPELERRLKTFAIRIPPLRERTEDTVLIAQALLNRLSPDQSLQLNEKAKTWLQSQEWHGDVRELRYVVEKAGGQQLRGLIDASDLELAIRSLREPTGVLLPHSNSAETLGRAIQAWVDEWLTTESSKSVPADEEFGILYEEFLAAVEKPFLEEVFHRLHGNRVVTASKLGLHRSTLRQKMRRYGID
ncbi:MAG: sigma-54 dependent transcriptional regulator [Pirellula sp.]|nr:sigma-54 dependent transcriptional regulator [Pirellula sp.]